VLGVRSPRELATVARQLARDIYVDGRAWCHAWHTQNIDDIRRIDGGSFGFGFRAIGARPNGFTKEVLEQFFVAVDYYHVAL
jgi:hypothetical protein